MQCEQRKFFHLEVFLDYVHKLLDPPGQRAVGIGINSSEMLSNSKLSSFLIMFISGN